MNLLGLCNYQNIIKKSYRITYYSMKVKIKINLNYSLQLLSKNIGQNSRIIVVHNLQGPP